MKVTQIAGFLGCGKTTLILKLSRELADDGKRKVALVVRRAYASRHSRLNAGTMTMKSAGLIRGKVDTRESVSSVVQAARPQIKNANR